MDRQRKRCPCDETSRLGAECFGSETLKGTKRSDTNTRTRQCTPNIAFYLILMAKLITNLCGSAIFIWCLSHVGTKEWIKRLHKVKIWQKYFLRHVHMQNFCVEKSKFPHNWLIISSFSKERIYIMCYACIKHNI